MFRTLFDKDFAEHHVLESPHHTRDKPPGTQFAAVGVKFIKVSFVPPYMVGRGSAM